MVSICSVNLSGEDEGCQDFFPIWERYNFICMLAKKSSSSRAVYKSGTGTREWGHRDACVGTWDSGTGDEGLKLRTSSMGRGDV